MTIYRSDEPNPPLTHVNFLFDYVGLGDCIAALPALKYTYDNFPHIVLHVWVPDFLMEIAKRSLPIDKKRVIIKPMSRAKKEYVEKNIGRSFKLFNFLSLACHPAHTGFLNFLNKEGRPEDMNYLPMDTSDQDITKFNLPEKYVCITTNFTSPVRQFLPEHINKIADYVLAKGYTPVFLGQETTNTGTPHIIEGKLDEEIDLSKGLDLINQTNLLEAREIIKGSKCFVGLDNGLAHLGGTTETPLVIGYTTVLPETRMPYRHDQLGWNCYPVVLSEQQLGCTGCQTKMNMTFNHNFMDCYYKDFKCLKMLNADMYIAELEKVLV